MLDEFPDLVDALTTPPTDGAPDEDAEADGEPVDEPPPSPKDDEVPEGELLP